MKRNAVIEQYYRNGLRPVLLVVDDQPINIRALHEVFKADFDVLMATNGESAIQQAIQHRPDVILLDIVMPGMDGYQVCETLNHTEATQDIPVIFVTAETESDVEARGFQVGAVDFITKPFNPLVVSARVMTHLTLKLQMDMMRNMALVDGLTGLFNRRRFDEALNANWHLCLREQRSLALIMLDVDFFKRYNDNYGHLAGDACLRKVADAVKQSVRRSADICCRYGGEEFACLMPFTDAAGARSCAERIITNIAVLQLPHETSDVSSIVTVSIGISCMTPHDDASAPQLLQNADAALYQSKQQGRNRISTWSGPAAEQSLAASSGR